MSDPRHIYVASSWRNDIQPGVVQRLRREGFEVYDFKKPKLHSDGFHWSEVMPSYERGSQARVDVEDYLMALEADRAVEGFDLDFGAMTQCGTCVLVLPCGASAHLELGWFVGQNRRTAILLDDPVNPELMYRMVDGCFSSMEALVPWLKGEKL